MKNLYVNGELVSSAEKIYITTTAIICSNGDTLNGFNFNDNIVEIKEDTGNVVEADKTDLQLLQEQLVTQQALVIELGQQATDMELANIELGQQNTDLELRLIVLEGI